MQNNPGPCTNGAKNLRLERTDSHFLVMLTLENKVSDRNEIKHWISCYFFNKVHLVDDHACVHSSVYNDSKQITFCNT